MKNPRGQYGKESGGKPFPAPQSFAEAYASDPTFGSALELAFPDTPQWFRVLLGGALDLALDPINLLAVKPVKTVVSTVGKQVGSTRAVQRVAQPIKDVAGAVGTRVMHPTAAKTVAQQVPRREKVKALSELGSVMEQSHVYSFSRNVGSEMLGLRNKLDDIIRRANEQGINIDKSHNILDFEKYLDAIKGASEGVDSTFNKVLETDVAQLSLMENRIRAVDPKLADEVSNLRSAIDELSDNWYRQAEEIDEHLAKNPNIRDSEPIRSGMWEGARAVYRREILPKRTILNKVIDAWKRSKTIYNLGTQTRNALQNFVFRYLTGDVDVADIARFPQAVRDMMRFRKMVEEIATQGRNADMFSERYKDLLDLAFILWYTRNKPSRIKALQQARGGRVYWLSLLPEWWKQDWVFTNRDSVSRGLRWEFLRKPPSPSDTVRTGAGAREQGIPISQLPRNWGDVLLFPFRRFGEIVREARAKQQSLPRTVADVVHNTALRAYNAGDVIPAMLMEIVRRRKALTAGKPSLVRNLSLRMDYSTVPETIGALNIALLPFLNYQYFALQGLKQALRRNPERLYNIVVKPIERSTRITQADDEQGVSQAPRFGFAEREMYPISPTHGMPYSTILPIDPQFAEPFLSLSPWVSRSPLLSIARPFVEHRGDTPEIANQLLREFTPASLQHALYALLGEPQRGMQPRLQHTRTERILRALGINIQPIDQMRIARQQQREAERKRNEPLYDDPATITGIVNRILRMFGW
jgi:hypothetical protein